jgi:hypothetical protein
VRIRGFYMRSFPLFGGCGEDREEEEKEREKVEVEVEKRKRALVSMVVRSGAGNQCPPPFRPLSLLLLP